MNYSPPFQLMHDKNTEIQIRQLEMNERKVIEAIKNEDRSKNIQNLDLDRFAAPFLLRGKKILQVLCKAALGWDDPIPEVMQNQWRMQNQWWVSELPLLEKIQIPRCFKSNTMGEIKKAELHHFSDASSEGYGHCSYLRLIDKDDKVNCSLVMGKACVAPLKSVTIPRLELRAALTSVKVRRMLGSELRYDGVEEVFWTDSKVVQGYIYNEGRRFHTYVANRVQQIRDHTNPKQWKYVDTNNNPAKNISLVTRTGVSMGDTRGVERLRRRAPHVTGR
ncbi:uncharacterized protein LOC116608834 [Nematostella vectensis]|uniref:uncharacterized protein LOC116608834 n=1 Tax=Nematostella vectensis TaxID=45351 RepID=UPI00138FBE1E|nr:uncharacterized protein LOC116608834 [Nematostella vectensis]